MQKLTNQQLMERIVMRLRADSGELTTASSHQLMHVTSELIDHGRVLNAVFNQPGMLTQKIGPKPKPKKAIAKR